MQTHGRVDKILPRSILGWEGGSQHSKPYHGATQAIARAMAGRPEACIRPWTSLFSPRAPKSLDLRISHTGGNINCPMHFIRLQIKLYTTNPDQRDQRTHLAIVVAGTGEERTLPGEEEPWDSERRPRFRLP